MENKRNLLVTLADEKYIQQAKQLFSSVYWNAGWDGDYMLLSHEIPESELLWFRSKGILIKECRLLLEKGWGDRNDLPPLIADKFYLFTEEFKKWKSIIYLDSDIIVKSSLDKLADVSYFSAAQNYYFSKLHNQVYNKTEFNSNGQIYDLNSPAFNAGVFVFNTDLITPDTFNELTDLLIGNNERFIYGEQTALNFYFYKKWRKLPPVYNVFMNYHNYKLPKIIKGIVLHFIARRGFPHLWETENVFFNEWKKNLEKAEFIDLSSPRNVKKWNRCKINYYSLLLNLFIIPDRIISRSGDFIKIKTALIAAANYPEKVMGSIGSWINRKNPEFYKKFINRKGGK